MRWLIVLLLVSCDAGAPGTHGTAPDGSMGGTADGAGGSPAADQLCVSETNRYRSLRSKLPLTASAQLEEFANTGARVDFGSSPSSHFSATQGGGIAFAENECPQQSNWQTHPGQDASAAVVDCLAEFFAEGTAGAHYQNMIGNFGSVGCGVYQVGTKITVVQDFGR